LQGDVAHREGNKGNKEHAGPESTKDLIKRKWQDLGDNTIQKPSRRAKVNNGSAAASNDNATTNDSSKGKTAFAPVTQSPPGKGDDVVGREDDDMEINDASYQPLPIGDTPTDIDEFDSNDPLCASTLVQEMYEVYRAKEMTMTPPAGYMDNQKFINERMRAILIDWLIDVHLKFKLVPETLHLTVNIIDRFLALAKITRQRLQLLGVTAFLIATKYEEVYPPDIPDLVYICAGSYTKAEILEMEETILKTLNYQVTIPSAHAFLVRYLKAAKADVQIVRLSCYILDGTLLSYDLLQYRPSQLAAAAVLIARRTVGRRNWSPTLDKYAQYSEDDILPVVRAVLSEKTLIPAELRAVRNKYKTARYGAVANIELPSDF
jgi:cyclin B